MRRVSARMMKVKRELIELTDEQNARIERLKALTDEEIDTSDIPVVLGLKNARRGYFYRPVKQQITMRVDADVVAWFKDSAGENGRGYQTEMNRALREHVVRTERGKAA